MAYFTKRYHPPGTPPGTLVEHAAAADHPLRLRLIDYSAAGLSEQDGVSSVQCKSSLADDTFTWIHAHGRAGPALMRELGETFGLHPLTLEDVLNTGQRPKVEAHDHQLFIVMSLPAWRDDQLTSEQVSLFLGKDYLISFYNGDDDTFEPVRKRLRADDRMRARGVDYLLHALLDLIIDQGFPILEAFGEEIEELENQLLDAPSKYILGEIHQLKRDLLLLRRLLWPQREVLSQLLREDQALIHEETKPYLRDCYDHTIQIMDLFETYRDMTANMLDVYLSSSSQRLNEIMRVLTVITTLFIPPTFLVGVYGMNFSNPDSPWAMPELHSHYGYPLVWLVIFAMIAGMLVFFKRRGWF